MNKKVVDQVLKDCYESMGKGHSSILARTMPEKLSFKCHVEITLKHPYNKTWLQRLSAQQKKFYMKAFESLKNVALQNYKDSGYVFEYHKSGNVHLHGFIVFEFTQMINPYGLISDIAKSYYAYLPKSSYYNPKFLADKYQRYASPAVCVQFFNWSEMYKPRVKAVDRDDEYEWEMLQGDCNISGEGKLEEWRKYLLKDNSEINK